MIWIASGSRSLTCKNKVYTILDSMLKRYGTPRMICTGSSYGVDEFVQQWTKEHNINYIVCNYNENFGCATIATRNDTMIRIAQKLDNNVMLILMWNGESHGSYNLKHIAEKLHINIEERILSDEYYN